jgi:hypothetical protein
MMKISNKENLNLQKIPGIFQDNSPENRELANRLLTFFIETTEIEKAPRSSFVFAIFRDSVVSSYLHGEGQSLEEVILSKAPYLADYPEELADFLALSQRDVEETRRNKTDFLYNQLHEADSVCQNDFSGRSDSRLTGADRCPFGC